MANRAPDIADLEKLLNDGEGDDLLNARAIEIVERLEEQVRRARNRADIARAKELEAEDADFRRVIAEILKRRHANVLERFIAHVYKRKVGDGKKK